MQQDYVFGCVGLCLCVYVYMWPKTGYLRSYHLKILVVQSTAHPLSLTAKKGCNYAR